MKQILIPTDFSDNSLNAIHYGLELFKDTRCTFHLLNVSPVPVYSGAEASVMISAPSTEKIVLKEALQNLKNTIAVLEKKHHNPNHYFVPAASYDYFVDAIKHTVVQKKIDLILMGTKGATGFKKVAIGSNTGDVITRVKCPLLAIPEKAAFSDLNEIAFPTDFQIGYDLRVLDDLLQIARINSASLRILHISKRGEELSPEQLQNKEFLADYLMDVPHTFHCIPAIRLDTAIQEFATEYPIDMIAMVAKNLNFFQKILFRPRVEEISYHTKIPFLVLHE